MQQALSRVIQDKGLREQMRQNLDSERDKIIAKVDSSILRQCLSSSGFEYQKEQEFHSSEAVPANCPQVTILIPTYNQERFIDQAIASAIAQDFGPMEIIVMDDASTDRY